MRRANFTILILHLRNSVTPTTTTTTTVMHSRTAAVLLTTVVTAGFLFATLEPLSLVMVLTVGIDMLVSVSAISDSKFVVCDILGVIITCGGTLVVVIAVLCGALI